jgi:hypothetical protein
MFIVVILTLVTSIVAVSVISHYSAKAIAAANERRARVIAEDTIAIEGLDISVDKVSFEVIKLIIYAVRPKCDTEVAKNFSKTIAELDSLQKSSEDLLKELESDSNLNSVILKKSQLMVNIGKMDYLLKKIKNEIKEKTDFYNPQQIQPAG